MANSPALVSLMYHDVTDDPGMSGFQRPGARPSTVSSAAFDRHLEQIASSGLEPVLITALNLHRRGRHLLLTFDDGGRSALQTAERLARRNWRAHFFVVTARIGNPKFLDVDQIRYLRSCGHLIGSHSHTHPDIFPDLDPWSMAEEWRVSADILAGILGQPCVAASVPGGDLSREVMEAASVAGYKYLFTSEPRLTPGRIGSCWILGRSSVRARTSDATIRARCALRGWSRELALRRASVTARRLFPPVYRWYVRRSTEDQNGVRNDPS